MAHTTLERPSVREARPRLGELSRRPPSDQAYAALYAGYTVLPFVAGIDKFFHGLVDWNIYLAPQLPRLLGVSADAFMRGVGVVEIAAGVLVAARPRWGSLVVGLWLLGIIGNLMLIPGYFDIALRDFGLSLGAFALWRLSSDRRHEGA